jgi:spore germination protein GerM
VSWRLRLGALWLGLALAGAALAQRDTTHLLVYFSNARLATDPADCAAVFARDRDVPHTGAVATAALQQLFAGPTPAEKAMGWRSPFSASTAGLLKSVRVRDGTAYVDLHDLRGELAGATSSCGAAEFQSQVQRTLRQFPSIQRVVIAIDGQPRTFYEWMNEDCGSANGRCNAAAFAAPGKTSGARP